MDCGINCSVSLENKESSKEYGHIDTNGLVALISADVPIVILDARSGQWDDGKRIASAKTLSSESTVQEVLKLIPNKKSLIIVYCSNVQCPAGGNLAKYLVGLGYHNLLKYDAGIQEWINSGHHIRETR